MACTVLHFRDVAPETQIDLEAMDRVSALAELNEANALLLAATQRLEASLRIFDRGDPTLEEIREMDAAVEEHKSAQRTVDTALRAMRIHFN